MNWQRKSFWTAPIVVAGVIGGMVLVTNQASGEPALPPLSAQQVVTNVLSAPATPFSGTVSVTTNLGLPDLSGLGNLFGMQGTPLTSLLAGTTTLQVASDPAKGVRVDLNSGTSAYVALADVAGKVGWTYSSSSNTATKYILPADATASSTPPTADVPTPQSTADQLLSTLDASTDIAVSTTTTVAGRAAYTLILTPKDAGSLIASVTMAVDASTWLPLRVAITSTQLPDTPALSVAFTAISYATPAASLFSYTAPAGATVNTVDLSQSAADKPAGDSTEKPATPDSSAMPQGNVVAGKGWASVEKITGVPADMAAALADPSQLGALMSGGMNSAGGKPGHGDGHGDNADSAASLSQLLGGIAQVTPQGTLYSTYLFSLLVTPAGDVYVGAVPAATLQAIA